MSTGKNADVSQFNELSWYELVMLHLTTISFPEDMLVLGKHLCPSNDVGPTMNAKILTPQAM